MNRKRGRNASRSGLFGEDNFESILIAAGWAEGNPDMFSDERLYTRQYPVPHPYRESSRSGRNDFMLHSSEHGVYVQVKNQDSSGTTDEKLSFAFDIAFFALAEIRFDQFWLVLLGKWWPQRPKLIEFCKRKGSQYENLALQAGHDVSFNVLVGQKEVAKAVRSLTGDQAKRSSSR